MKNNTIISAFLLLCLNLLAQNTWTVDNRAGTTAQFTSIQTAHDAAASGDSIYIHPSSTSYGSIVVTKKIHLIGLGHNPELGSGLNATLSTITFSSFFSNPSHPSNSSVVGLKFTEIIIDSAVGQISNVLIQNNSIVSLNMNRAYNCVIQGNIFTTPFAQSIQFPSNHSNNLISHNIFNIASNGFSTQGAIVSANSTETIANNIFIFNGTTDNPGIFSNSNGPIVNNNIFVINNAISNQFRNPNSTVNFQNCLTFSYGGQTIAPLAGTNNLNNTNPQFLNIGTPENPLFSYTKSYKLKTGSPALNAGSDGDNIGIYGQGFLFQMRGYPFDLPYITNININNETVEAGSNLNVTVKANANVEN